MRLGFHDHQALSLPKVPDMLNFRPQISDLPDQGSRPCDADHWGRPGVRSMKAGRCEILHALTGAFLACCGVMRITLSSDQHHAVPVLSKLCLSDVESVQERLPEGTQTHFRSIVTDQHCRVLGSEGTVYAIGDAATIQQVQPPA